MTWYESYSAVCGGMPTCDHSYALSPSTKCPPSRKKKTHSLNACLLAPRPGSVADLYRSLNELQPPEKNKNNGADKENSLHPGMLVTLLHEGKAAATAQLLEGNKVHGTILPSYFVRVVINEVKNSAAPLHLHTTFDDGEALVPGMFTAWEKYAITKLD